MRHFKKALFLLFACPQLGWSQINADRVMLMGRNALYYEDYVLSMQYFNMVINAKPYLSEPYFYRGLAKFYLEDFSGASEDCKEAIEKNPFVARNYELLGLCFINLKQYEEACEAYRKLLKLEPENRNGWYNYILCEAETKRYDQAMNSLDSVIRKWPDDAQFYTVKAQVAFQQKDTVTAEQSLNQALKVDQYDERIWEMLAMISLNREDYKAGEEQLTQAISINKRNASYYVNRALARYHQRNLRGAMSDYDEAIVVDPKSYIGHFNRGLLRAQVGDDNRAIEDFNFVLEVEPDNMIALFNRALMRNNTGDYRGALKDLSAVIKEYPTFWTGYQLRATIRRKLGDVNGAERDEFKVMKAQMEARYQGKKFKTSNKTRKKSDLDMNDYDKLVEEDTVVYAQKYSSEYRGKIQNKQVEVRPEAMFVLTYHPQRLGVERSVAYHPELEKLNQTGWLPQRIALANHEQTLDRNLVQKHFARLETLAQKLEAANPPAQLYLERALEYYTVQDYDAAMDDVNKYLERNPEGVLGYFLRAQIKIRQLEAFAGTGQEKSTAALQIGYNAALTDLEAVLRQIPDFKYAYYNIGYIYMLEQNYAKAEQAFTQALKIDANFAEALFNRGVACIKQEKMQQAVSDLSQAGELGLYDSYSLIKKYADYRK